MTDKLSPERSMRLLRAKVAELESYSLGTGTAHLGSFGGLAADIALVAALLADEIERRVENDPLTMVGDPLFNEDGIPWTDRP